MCIVVFVRINNHSHTDLNESPNEEMFSLSLHLSPPLVTSISQQTFFPKQARVCEDLKLVRISVSLKTLVFICSFVMKNEQLVYEEELRNAREIP